MTAFFGIVAIGYGAFGGAWAFKSDNDVGALLGAVSAGVGVLGFGISVYDLNTLHGRC